MSAPSRRRLLTGLAAVAGAVGLGAATAASTTSHADAALIALCTEFTELEKLSRQIFDQIPDDDECDDMRAPIQDRQNHLAELIEGLKPTSVAGFAAMARAAAAWAPEIVREEQSETHHVLISALLRGLIEAAA
jgi:hypothetical protein